MIFSIEIRIREGEILRGMSTRDESLPFIIFIDLDGTIVGNVTNLVSEWELIQEYNKIKMKDFKKSLVNKLRKGMLRENLSDFCSMIQGHYKCVEFFIYTASESKWANFLVNSIEEATGLTFQRPVLTRNNCIERDQDYKKSIDHVMPIVMKRIKKIYPRVTKPSQLKHRVCLIDNNDVMVEKEKDRVIKCPTYDFIEFYDVFSRIGLECFEDENDCSALAKNIMRYGLYPSAYISHLRSSYLTFPVFRYYYYDRLCENMRRALKQPPPSSDKFWTHLAYAMTRQNMTQFDPESIKKIMGRTKKERQRDREGDKEKIEK